MHTRASLEGLNFTQLKKVGSEMKIRGLGDLRAKDKDELIDKILTRTSAGPSSSESVAVIISQPTIGSLPPLVVAVSTEEQDYSKMTMTKLKEIAKSKSIPRYSTYTKDNRAELEAILRGDMAPPSASRKSSSAKGKKSMTELKGKAPAKVSIEKLASISSEPLDYEASEEMIEQITEDINQFYSHLEVRGDAPQITIVPADPQAGLSEKDIFNVGYMLGLNYGDDIPSTNVVVFSDKIVVNLV